MRYRGNNCSRSLDTCVRKDALRYSTRLSIGALVERPHVAQYTGASPG